MNRILVSLLIVWSSTLCAQDNFKQALIQLEKDLGYKSEKVNGDKLYHEQPEIDELQQVAFARCATNYDYLKDLDFSRIQKVKYANVKSEMEIEQGLYLRVSIQEWIFESEKDATSFKEVLDVNSNHSKQCLSKGGITWWQKNNQLYLIISNVYRFSYEFDSIKASLDKKL